MEKYIVLWNENGEKRWDRIEKDKLFDFIIEKDVVNDEDSMVFKSNFQMNIFEKTDENDDVLICIYPPNAVTNSFEIISEISEHMKDQQNIEEG